MSRRRQLVTVQVERREPAHDRLDVLTSGRVPLAGVPALVEAAGDAVAEGRVGTGADLLTAGCSPEHVERVLLEMLEDTPTPAPPAGQEKAA